MKRKIESTPDITPEPKQSRPDVNEEGETINDDDLCAICHLLLYRPVTTTCGHTLCESCMAHWADVSITSQMTAVGLDDEAMTLLPNEIETRCPMCRTLTTATLDPDREHDLRTQYPQAYISRKNEESVAEEDGLSVETLTLYIGNTHQLVEPEDTSSGNKHEWRFFVRPSRTDLIEEVHVFLHPTFRNSQIVLQYPPYEIRRLGWGIFTISTSVILKAGYTWVSSEAEDAPDGGKNGKLTFNWTLDFYEQGTQGRFRLKVRKEKEGQEEEDAAQRESVRRLWLQQRENDPDWVE